MFFFKSNNLLNSRSLKRVSAILLITSLSLNTISAQAFKKYNIPLSDYLNTFYIQEIPIEVSGLPNKMDTTFGLEKIKLTLHHNRTSDLKIQLQAPDGTTCWVTNRNGKEANYINTQFSQYGKDGLINNAKNPFVGNYIPDGQITYFTNGSNPNGTWKLLVEDLRAEESGLLDSITLYFGKHPAFIRQKRYCSFKDPKLCVCNAKTKELLPDLVIIPSFTKNQIQEFASNDSSFPHQLKISVAIANIGLGPLEVAPDTTLTSTCCTNDTTQYSDKRYNVFQKIYSLDKNDFTSTTKKAGTIYYEKMPGHHHFHVDDWIEMRLVKIINGKRIIMCKGSKVSYCLFTTGMLYEKDSSSIINGKIYGTNMSNYGLGDYFACSLAKQGISVGGYDYYGLMYEGQYLKLPRTLKNGNYILEIEIDPHHWYKESNKSNNIFKMPLIISKQNK